MSVTAVSGFPLATSERYFLALGFFTIFKKKLSFLILESKAYRPPENPHGRRRYLFLQPTIYKWRVIKTEEENGVRKMELNKQNSTVCEYLQYILILSECM